MLWRRRKGRRRRKRTEKKIGERDQKPTVLSTNSERFVKLISKFKLNIEEQFKRKKRSKLFIELGQSRPLFAEP